MAPLKRKGVPPDIARRLPSRARSHFSWIAWDVNSHNCFHWVLRSTPMRWRDPEDRVFPSWDAIRIALDAVEEGADPATLGEPWPR